MATGKAERSVLSAKAEQHVGWKSFRVVTARTRHVPRVQHPVELMSPGEWWKSGRLLPFKFHAPVEMQQEPVKGTIREKRVPVIDLFPGLGGKERAAGQQKRAIDVAQKSPGKKIG